MMVYCGIFFSRTIMTTIWAFGHIAKFFERDFGSGIPAIQSLAHFVSVKQTSDFCFDRKKKTSQNKRCTHTAM